MIPGELIDGVRERVKAGARVVVIDSLTGLLSTVDSSHVRFLILTELLSWLAERGVITIVVQASSPAERDELSPVTSLGSSHLCDSILWFRHKRAEGNLIKTVVASKRRGGFQSTQPRRIDASERGLHLEPLRQESGPRKSA